MNSLLNYYGGKHFFKDEIISRFPSRLEYKTYIEGFGGSASILFKKPIDPIEIYNDLDKNVYSVFKVLSDKDMFQRFKEKLDLTPYSREIWAEYKSDLSKDLDLEERAYKFFYVNKSSFNSVGGFSVTSNDSRRNMMKSTSDYLSTVDRLIDYHQRVSRVVIENLDIFKLIEKYDTSAKSAFFLLDPPYVMRQRASNQKYREEFSNEQHEKLIDYCNNMKSKVMICGYDDPIYDNLKGFEKVSFPSPNAKSDATETLWVNY